jgi:hypothetical protein
MTLDELNDLLDECEKWDHHINFGQEIAAYDWSQKPDVPGWMTDYNSKYLRMLAAWCKIHPRPYP